MTGVVALWATASARHDAGEERETSTLTTLYLNTAPCSRPLGYTCIRGLNGKRTNFMADNPLPLYHCNSCGTSFTSSDEIPYCPGNSPHHANYTVTRVYPERDVDPAAALLDEATKIVTGARRQSYGTPEDNFACIADLWNMYLNRRADTVDKRDYMVLVPTDVAVMMILMKCARLAETPTHHDSAVDIAGYAACLARCQNS